MQVWYSVMSVVLRFPPLDGESLTDISDNNAHKVAVLSILEDLVMEEVVSEPTALLPEKCQDNCADHVNSEVVGHYGAGD